VCARIDYIYALEQETLLLCKESEMDNFLKLFDLIGILARRRHQSAEQHFSALGLNHTEARLLTLLHQEKGVATQDELSSLIFVDRSNAGRGLKSLEQEGFIKRCENESNKKTKLVQLTAKGRQAVVEISKQREKMAQSFFGDLKEDDAGIVAELLQKAFTNEDDGTHSNMFGNETSEK
jgi:DNA-binding MarR family transcriptional regulator